MPKLIALWSKPDDVTGFDADYLQTHAALAAKIPGVTFEGVKVMQGEHHRIAILSFDSMESFQAGMGSPEAAAVMEDAGRLQGAFGVRLDTIITE